MSTYVVPKISGETTPVQVLVVGAGPSGLVLTLVLLRNGVRVRLIEKDLAARIGQRGAGIMPRSMEIFHLLGVVRDIQQQGIYPPRVRVYEMPDGTKPLQTFDMQPWTEPTPGCPYLNIQMLGQDNLETILRDALAQYHCHVEQSTELQSFQQHQDCVIATMTKKLGDGSMIQESARFDYLIGTDGARGIVRKLLGLSFLGETRVVEHLVVGDVTVEGLGEDYWHMWGDASTTLVSLRPTEMESSFNFMIAGCDVDHASLANDPEAVTNFMYEHTGNMRSNGMRIKDVTWLSHYKPNIRMVDTFGHGRVLLVGDSAHVHSPTGGQGMNTGVQDAFNLAWKLALVAQGYAPASLLDTYTEERLPVIADMLDQTTLILKNAFQGKEGNAWPQTERQLDDQGENRCLSLDDDTSGSRNRNGVEDSPEDRSPWLRPGSLLQLGVNYRWSSVVIDEQTNPSCTKGDKCWPDTAKHDSYGRKHAGCLKAGDRAPDAPNLIGVQLGRDGKPREVRVRLFDVFGPSWHTVIALTDPTSNNSQIAQSMTALGMYPPELIRLAVVYPLTSHRSLPDFEHVDYLLADAAGHAYQNYNLANECRLVVVRPDGYVGAIVQTSEGLKRYFNKVFSSTLLGNLV